MCCGSREYSNGGLLVVIRSKKDLKEYLKADKIALGRKEKRPKYYDLIWKFERELRYCEYYKNCRKDIIGKFLYWFHKYKKHKIGVLCNFSIGENVCDKGLSIAHIGPIIINSHASIGENCRIHVGTNIGTSSGERERAPVIGANVIYWTRGQNFWCHRNFQWGCNWCKCCCMQECC